MANAHRPQGNHGQGGGLGAPSTPRKDGAQLNQLVKSLNEQFQLRLPIRGKEWSPSTSTGLPDKVYSHIQRLYWAPGDQLVLALGRLQVKASETRPSDHLRLFYEVLQGMETERVASSQTRKLDQFRAYKEPDTDHCISFCSGRFLVCCIILWISAANIAETFHLFHLLTYSATSSSHLDLSVSYHET